MGVVIFGRFRMEFVGDFFFGISLTHQLSDPVKRRSILFTSQSVSVGPLLQGKQVSTMSI